MFLLPRTSKDKNKPRIWRERRGDGLVGDANGRFRGIFVAREEIGETLSSRGERNEGIDAGAEVIRGDI